MKKQELKKLTKSEVLKNIDKLKKDLFNFRRIGYLGINFLKSNIE